MGTQMERKMVCNNDNNQSYSSECNNENNQKWVMNGKPFYLYQNIELFSNNEQ